MLDNNQRIDELEKKVEDLEKEIEHIRTMTRGNANAIESILKVINKMLS